jgi:hypothetical protein
MLEAREFRAMQNFLDQVAPSFYICSYATRGGEGRVSGSVEAVPPAAACSRSGGGGAPGEGRAERDDRRLLEPRRFDRWRRGSGGRDGGARLEMAPQRLEKVEFAPGNGMAPAAPDPNIWYGRAPRLSSPKNSRRLSPEGRCFRLTWTSFLAARGSQRRSGAEGTVFRA